MAATDRLEAVVPSAHTSSSAAAALMDPARLLESMLADMRTADALYRPTHFWDSGLPVIAEDLRTRGFASFRAHPSAHFWYVPLYAHPRYRKHAGLAQAALRVIDFASGRRRLGARVQRIFEGRPALQRDYDVFVAAQDDRPPRLTGFGESDAGQPLEQFSFDGANFSKAFLNYLRGLSFLKRHIDLAGMPRVLEIGGGYGALGEIVLKMSPDTVYVDVDIPPLAAVSTYYLREVFGRDAVYSYDQSRPGERVDLDAIARSYRAAVLCPWQLPLMDGKVDLFVNFMSFQEMEPHVVHNYARQVSRLTRRCVLLRNSRHGKPAARKPSDIGVIDPIGLDDMVRMFDRFSLLARDAGAFCDATWDRGFVSELAVLARR